MIMTFKVILMIILVLSGIMSLDKKSDKEFRIKAVALSMASMIGLIVAFMVL